MAIFLFLEFVMAVVSLKDLHKSYPLGKESVEAVKGVSFEIDLVGN